MTHPNFILLYVNSPVESAHLYSQLLAKPPIEASPTFAMFALDSGLMLGLWARQTVAPAASCTGGGTELAFTLDSVLAVDALHEQWLALGLPILQAPTAMDFGYTFTAADPDGHRLRAFVPQGR